MDYITEDELLDAIRAALVEENDELDEEQLDELSKQTLKSYVKKAGTSSERAWAKADKEEDKAMSTDGNKYPEKQKRHQDAANKAIDTWNKRRKGTEAAKKRLTKEETEHFDDIFEEIVYSLLEQAEAEGIELDEEQLDELSKKTLGSYTMHAAQSYANHSVDKARHDRDTEQLGRMHHNNTPEMKKHIDAAQDQSYKASYQSDRKRVKRGRGIERAMKRLTKESIEEMIAAAHNGTPVEFAAAFGSAMQAAVLDKIDDMRPAVAATMFGSQE